MTRRQEIGIIIAFLFIIYVIPITQIIIEIKAKELPHIIKLGYHPSTVEQVNEYAVTLPEDSRIRKFLQWVTGTSLPRVITYFLPTEVHLRAWESEMEDRSFIENLLRPPMQYLQYVIGRDAGSKAIVGRDGWLFYTPVLDYLTGPYYDDPRIIKPVDAGPKQDWQVVECIEDFYQQLKARGIDLLVVPVPAKLTILPDKATRRKVRDRLDMGAHTRRLLTELARRNIPVIDLFGPFVAEREKDAGARQEMYMYRDTHWTGRTLRLVARIVADRVKKFPWYPEILCITDYEVRDTSVVRYGDIGEMTQIPHNRELFPPETTLCFRVYEKETKEAYRNKGELEWEDIYVFFKAAERARILNDIDVEFKSILEEFIESQELEKEYEQLKKKKKNLSWEEVYNHFKQQGRIKQKIDVQFKQLLQEYLVKQRMVKEELKAACTQTPILFLGDSFSRIFQTDAPQSAGFISHLAYELKTPLEAIVNNGGASTLVREQLVRKSSKLKGKKLVIWEFTERDVRFGMNGWKKLELP